ncbi:MAG: type II toxin-antitoxin system VapC family toxin [Acidithiobacillales bacterium]
MALLVFKTSVLAPRGAAGKLPGALDVAADIAGCMDSQGFRPLDIMVGHSQWAESLPPLHRDLFDRMLVAQALVQGLPLLSNDAVFRQVRRPPDLMTLRLRRPGRPGPGRASRRRRPRGRASA